MKQLQLPVPFALVMVGLPGAGKSFFARQFAKMYQLPYIADDRIRHELFNKPSFTPREQEIVGRIGSYMVGELLHAKQSFIIDTLAGNSKAQRLQLGDRARQHGFRTLIIWVQVDEPTAKIRALKHQPDDPYGQALPEAIFSAWQKRLAPPKGEEYVVISGKHTFLAQRKAVLRKILPTQAAPKKEVTKPVALPAGKPGSTRPSAAPPPTPVARRGNAIPRPANRRIHIS